jgi:hypothetical protein
MICKYCNGTGADAKKTEAARKTGRLDSVAYVRCWMCNGNGSESPYPDYSKHKEKSKANSE